MNRKEVHIIAKAYLERNTLIESNNNIGVARARESMIKKYLANRSRQLGTFLVDALSLKDIIFDEETPCENPRFASGAVEYYSLDLIQLENYFSYRTLVKRGEYPTNNHPNFLVLYLMEIVNGIYGNGYEEKRKKLNSVSALYSKGAKYRSLIQEAYEILYLQNINSLNKEEYFSSVDHPLFKDTSLTDNKTGSSNIPLDDIFKVVKIEKFTAINAKDKYILRDCFEYLYKELNDNDEFEIGYYKTMEELFSFDYKLSFDSPLNKLKAYYPITTNIKYSNKKGNQEVIANGIHVTKKVFYDDSKLFQINRFLTMVTNSIQHNCGGIPLPRKQKEKRNVYSYFANSKSDMPDVLAMVDSCVGKWVSQNTYAREGYLLSLETMMNIKERGSFKLDISDVSKVRKQSSDIQNKLIIDDGESTPIIIPKTPTNPFVEHSSHEDEASAYFKKLKVVELTSSTQSNDDFSEDNEFETLVKQLSPWEREIIKLLCNGEVDAAKDIASNKGKMLSLVVDKINTKSNSLIEDVIIIDNELVEDYKDELMQALR
jgi:hypothetical protein